MKMEGGCSVVETSAGGAIKTLGSLFSITQVFLRDDSYVATTHTLPGSLHNEETKDEMELARQLSALGLPMSFRTSKVMRDGLVKCKKKGKNRNHSHGHEENEVATYEVGCNFVEEEYSEKTTSSITCGAMEEPECQGFSRVTSAYSLSSDTALYSESSEVLNHDEIDSKETGDSEVWASYWDSFYNRYFFYNTITNESTWDPPPGMEHSAFGEVIDKQDEIIFDIAEDLGLQCSIESFGESRKSNQSSDQIPCEPGLRFELAVDNFHSPTFISTLNHCSGNLNEEKEPNKSCFEGSSFDQLNDYVERGEIKLEEKGTSNVPHSPINWTIDEEETENIWSITKRKKKERKRTRSNRKLSISSGELYFEGIIEECIPGEKGMLEELSANISKYWCQRHLLFSKYDLGIKMDEEGWFSATPEPIAKHHAFRCGDGVVVDCFTGVGGNAIQFAQRSKHVVAIDIDPKKIEFAEHNAAIYGVSDNIDFIVGDSFVLAPRLKANTVFLSPPWGGPNYLKATTYDINTMLKPHSGFILFNAVKGIASKVVMFLPRTVDLNQLAELSLSADPPWSLEVERNFLNGKLKAITAYFTDMSL